MSLSSTARGRCHRTAPRAEFIARNKRRRFFALAGHFAVAMAIASTVTASDPAPDSSDPPHSSDAVDEYVRAEMVKRRIPGLGLAVIKGGKVAKLKGYGVANLEHDVPATADTVFELASLTKQFTATAVMRLVESGQLKLEDPIVKRHQPQRRIATHDCPLAADSGSHPMRPDLTVEDFIRC